MNNYVNISNTAYVYVDSIFAGTLEKIDEGYSFKYDSTYLKESSAPVSLTIPLREDAYISKVLFPFFDGLIPEGWLLDMVIERYHVSPMDRFALLLLTGEDTIGNVSVRSQKI